jgi:hypothetical protein
VKIPWFQLATWITKGEIGVVTAPALANATE